MTIRRLIGVTLALTWAGYGTSPAQSPSTAPTTEAASTYWVYVANESSDLVSRVRFGPDGAIEEKTYYFRFVLSDGTPLDAYSEYPTLTTAS